MEQGGVEGTSSTQSPSTTVEIKIKTLDSHDYTCVVDQNISIPALKEHVAALTGVPVERQRLICRGKVLKDDHNLSAYNVEDGHVLHLVTREVPASDATSGGSRRPEESAAATGDSASAGAAQGRPDQVSHSVVLGTFTIPDHGEGALLDVSRIISSVLSSLGVANLSQPSAVADSGAVGTALPVPQLPVRAAQDEVTNLQRAREVGGGHPPSSFQSAPGQGTVSTGGAQTNPPTVLNAMPALGQQVRTMQHQVIPDSLFTMSQYLNRLEQVSGNPASVQTSVGATEAARTYPTPSNLGGIIRRTVGLLSGRAGAELLNLASQLENDSNLTEVMARGDVQSSAMRDGVLLQHLGALLLELGRATLTLRMGLSPAEAAVNSGPAVFISQAGPNPMMVQPLPFQMAVGLNPLAPHNFGGLAASGSPEVPRNINIHIHTNETGIVSGRPTQVHVPFPVQGGLVLNERTALPAQVTRPSPSSTSPDDGGEGSTPSGPSVSERVPSANNSSSLAEQSGVRVVPMRTVVAAVPSSLHGRPAVDNAGAALGLLYPLHARFQQLNAQQANAGVQTVPPGPPVLGSTIASNQAPSSLAPTVRAQVQIQAWVPQLAERDAGPGTIDNGEILNAPGSSALLASQAQEPLETSGRSHRHSVVPQSGPEQLTSTNAVNVPSSPGQQCEPNDDTTLATRETAVNGGNITSAGANFGIRQGVPVGLGLNGLQPLRPHPRGGRRPNRQHALQQISVSQQDVSRRPSDVQRPPVDVRPPVAGTQMSADSAGIAQLLSAVVNQPSGVGSNPDVRSMNPQVIAHWGGENLGTSMAGSVLPPGALGNVMGQVMQSPFMRNMVQQMLEQVDEEPGGVQDVIAGLGSEGGLNFSGILRNMMPIVRQALNRANSTGSVQQMPMGNTVGENIARVDIPSTTSEDHEVTSQSQSRSTHIGGEDEAALDKSAETEANAGSAPPLAKRQKIDLEKAIEKVEQGNSAADFIRVIAESAATLNDFPGQSGSHLAEQLSQNDQIVNEYITLLLRDLGACL